MHGTVMMFLFAVPILEAISILLLPAMLGARDLPFHVFLPSVIGASSLEESLFADRCSSTLRRKVDGLCIHR